MPKSLMEQIYDLENLYLASKKAMKGKKSTPAVAKFWMREDEEILRIHQQLKRGSYPFGYYTEFEINDKGVKRKISAAPFRDRVVHHAIMNVIEPLFEKSFIYDSYANRKGKGVSAALYRAKKYARKYKYYLKLDIKKYFPSIDHSILKGLVRKKIKCEKTLVLLDSLINSSNRQYDAHFYFENDTLFTPYEHRKGIPLGNLTSQFFGNLYLNRFDHYVKEVLRVGYIRYVDDFVLFFDNKEKREEYFQKIKEYLTRFRLKLHPHKVIFGECWCGFEMLGHKVFPTHLRLSAKSIKRSKSRFINIRYEYQYGKLELHEAKNRIFGTVGFMNIGDNFRLIETLLAQTPLQKVSLEAVPSWR